VHIKSRLVKSTILIIPVDIHSRNMLHTTILFFTGPSFLHILCTVSFTHLLSMWLTFLNLESVLWLNISSLEAPRLITYYTYIKYANINFLKGPIVVLLRFKLYFSHLLFHPRYLSKIFNRDSSPYSTLHNCDELRCAVTYLISCARIFSVLLDTSEELHCWYVPIRLV
jgi:hypothetical protein